MRRRSWIGLGLGASALLAVAGGPVAWHWPGVTPSGLSTAGARVMRTVAEAVLEGSLPVAPAEREAALGALLRRVDALVTALPPGARGELSQLMALLSGGTGRRLLAGLEADWPDASRAQVQQALESMRLSRVALRRQAYQALRDVATGAYFSDPSAWAFAGYPGPDTL
jgi:hypothetical protein